MENRFFVMVYAQNLKAAFPIMDSDTDIVKFWATAEEARTTMNGATVNGHPLAALGYEVFEMGTGE